MPHEKGPLWFDTVEKESDYKRRARQADPLIDHLNTSTSNWATDQLLASRVLGLVVKKQLKELPLTTSLGPHSDEIKHQVKRRCEADLDDKLHKLCKGPDATDPPSSSEHARRWKYHCHRLVWAALDQVKDINPVPDSFEHAEDDQHGPSTPRTPRASQPQQAPTNASLPPLCPDGSPSEIRSKSGRPSRRPWRPGYVSSAIQQFDDSSSSSRSSVPPSSSPHPAYIPSQGPSAALPERPEILTVRFISAFIREALVWLPGQNSADANPVVTFDDTPAKHRVALEGDVSFVSEDDGGLILLHDGTRAGRVASLEAKRAIGNSSVEGQPSMSDEWLGQIVGEALAKILAHKPRLGRQDSYDLLRLSCIIVIAPARHYVCFLQVDMTDDYLTQLNDHAFRDDAEFSEFICVSSTVWFDLTDAGDRRRTIKNLALIVSLSRNPSRLDAGNL
ncbi:hypothetical protein CPLU01_15105 [Colletotrichum plurivorum]|uniref:Uncharacterized protein n=1 Tax=Colletotrichum plurivorum TaxID=2175906 RepID=A0A8H6JE72_9PEZI|nr:hypothetical protein CPLU01_15105 [Colletotrichum plurivorum]